MDDDGLGAEVLTAGVIHRHVVIQVGVRLDVGYAILSSLSARAVDVDSGLLSGIQALFLL